MGYIKDEHIILSGYKKENLDEIRTKLIKKIAKNLSEDGYPSPAQTAGQFIPPVISTLANISYILYIPSDGSKEGWTTSNDMDDVREWLYRKIDKYNAASTDDTISIILVEKCDYNGLSVKKMGAN